MNVGLTCVEFLKQNCVAHEGTARISVASLAVITSKRESQRYVAVRFVTKCVFRKQEEGPALRVEALTESIQTARIT